MASWWERHGVPRLIKCACSQGQVMKLRSKVVAHARGHVLELGCGGGLNMEFYRPGQIESFSGIDPSPDLPAMSVAAAAARRIEAAIRARCGEPIPGAGASFYRVAQPRQAE